MKAFLKILSSLQVQVYLLVVLTLIPALLGVVWLIRFSEDRALDYAYERSRQMGHAAGNMVELSLEQFRTLLQSTATSAGVQALDGEACNTYLRQVQGLHFEFAAMSLLRASGEVVCTQAEQSATLAQVFDAPWFKQAITGQSFSASDAWQDPTTLQWKTVLTYPVSQPGVGRVGLLVLAVDLAALRDRVFRDVPAGALVTVVGTDNRMLMRSSAHQDRVGKPIPERFVRALQDRTQDTLAETGVDGVDRLYAIDVLPTTHWQVWAALPEREVMAPYRAQLRNSLLAVLPLALLLLILTWWLLNRALAPVKALAKVAEEVSAGSMVARASLQGPLEIRVVAEELNRMLDVTARVRAELQDSLAFNRNVLDGLQSHIAVLDEQGVVLMVNDAWLEYARAHGAGQFVDRFVGMNYLDTCRTAPQETNASAVAKGIRRVLSGELAYFEDQYPCHSPDQQRWFQMNCSRLPGNVVRAVVAHTDITAVKEMEEQIRQMAYFDALTGLPNRRLLADRLTQACAATKRSGKLCALMVLDLDNFKALNDLHGHAVGDLLLKQVGARLTDCVRSADTVARFGGDEFVVLLGALSSDPQESTIEAGVIAEKIRLRLAEPYPLLVSQPDLPDATVSHTCTAAIGVAVFAHFKSDLESTFKLADAAMYEAKAAGRNTVRFSAAQLPN